MSSRARSLNKPYWKRRTKSPPSYVREFAYDKEGMPVLNDGFYVVKNQDGTLEYDREQHIYRDRPNRALTRRIYADMKKGLKNEDT